MLRSFSWPNSARGGEREVPSQRSCSRAEHRHPPLYLRDFPFGHHLADGYLARWSAGGFGDGPWNHNADKYSRSVWRNGAKIRARFAQCKLQSPVCSTNVTGIHRISDLAHQFSVSDKRF